MKNWKHYLTVYFMAFIVFLIIGCGDKDCDCDPKAHLGINEKCSCGGAVCECTEQTAILADTFIAIRKQAGVTVAQMNGAVERVNAAYNGLNGAMKGIFLTKVTEVRITSGNVASYNTGIWYIGLNATDDTIVDSAMDDITHTL